MAQNKQGIWRYQLTDMFSYKSHLLAGIEYANHWLTIMDGEVVISRGYAWDGCSPTYYVPIFGWVGTPDGKRDADGIPQSYYASLVHDVLCQFRRELPISKETTVALFRQMLIEGGFSENLANLYSVLVDWFGPQDFTIVPSARVGVVSE